MKRIPRKNYSAEVRRRLAAGDKPDAIATDLGCGRTTVYKHRQAMAAEAGLPKARRLDLSAEVMSDLVRRIRAGERVDVIAAAIGCTGGTVRRHRRRLATVGLAPASATRAGPARQPIISSETGQPRRRRLDFSTEEIAALGARILAGEATSGIARAIGCSIGTVHRYRRVRAEHGRPSPLCACGKPIGHRGRCALSPETRASLEAAIREGRTAREMARELDISSMTALRYATPILAELRDEGISCACGRPRGHGGGCAGVAAGANAKIGERVTEMLLAGRSGHEVSEELGLPWWRVHIAARQEIAGLAEKGFSCLCGRPITHAGECDHRGAAKSRASIKYGPVARLLPYAQRRRVAQLAVQGYSVVAIAERMKVDRRPVSAVIRALTLHGTEFPAHCPCGRSRNHQSPCDPRLTRGPLGKRSKKPSDAPPQIDDLKVRKKAQALFRAGASVREISLKTGLSHAVSARAANRWRRDLLRADARCDCGRPLRHFGRCPYNGRTALGKRWDLRIEQMIMAGNTVREIADELSVSVATVLKRAAEPRRKLFASGVTCACGRPIGHRYICSANWDRYGLWRGPLPIDPAIAAAIRKALLEGDRVGDICARTGIGEPTVSRLRSEMSERDLTRRAERLRERRKINRRDNARDLYQRVERAVDGADPAYRDDVLADIYMAVVEGRLEPEQIEQAASRMIRREWWDQRRAAPSADELLTEDGTASRADRLEDDTFLHAIGDMAIGGERS